MVMVRVKMNLAKKEINPGVPNYLKSLVNWPFFTPLTPPPPFCRSTTSHEDDLSGRGHYDLTILKEDNLTG